MSADRVENLRAWQLTYKFKLAVYELLRVGPITADLRLSGQLREAAASAVSQIEEGFARFYPQGFRQACRRREVIASRMLWTSTGRG
jgi:hypothetical protein